MIQPGVQPRPRPGRFGCLAVFVALGLCLVSPPLHAAAKKSGKKVKHKFNARVMASSGYKWRPDKNDEDKRHRGWLALDQARLKFSLRRAKWRLKLSADLADALEGASDRYFRYLRNAYAEWRPNDHVRLRIGHFKRPFSRLALESSFDLWSTSRGLFHNYGVRRRTTSLSYGMRGSGVMFRYGYKLAPGKGRIYASLTQPGEDFRDLAGHLMWSQNLGELFKLDLYSTLKKRTVDDLAHYSNASGISTTLQSDRLYFLAQFHAFQNWRAQEEPWGAGALMTAYYGILDKPKFQLGPVFTAEWLDDDLSEARGQTLRLVGTVRAALGKRVGMWLEGEWRQPIGSDTEDAMWKRRLLAQLQLVVSL